MPPAELNAPAGFRLTGWHVLAIITTFFVTVIGVDVGMATMAYRTFSGEVAADPYEAGRLFNRILAQRKAEAALGWRASIADGAGGSIQLRMVDRSGQPVRGLKVDAKLERPATEAGSVVVAFVETAPGVYDVRPTGLTGAWDISASAVDSRGRLFEAERRVIWP